MNTACATIPVLYPITLSDWIDKLGERALVCWLQLHSWKTEPTPEAEPYCLGYSLNKLIKKLKVGKNTFYKKILEPLAAYGLIGLKRTDRATRETHLVLYSFPQNCPEKAMQPLVLVSPAEEIPAGVKVKPTPVTPPAEQKPLTEEPLPMELSTAVLSDPKASKHLSDIGIVYNKLRTHPAYTAASFLQKLTNCLQYNVPRYRFAAYFQKSLQNEWDKPQTKRQLSKRLIPTVPTQAMKQCPTGVPPWVWEQEQRMASGQRLQVSAPITPEQQAEAQELLRRLAGIGT